MNNAHEERKIASKAWDACFDYFDWDVFHEENEPEPPNKKQYLASLSSTLAQKELTDEQRENIQDEHIAIERDRDFYKDLHEKACAQIKKLERSLDASYFEINKQKQIITSLQNQTK